jgi:glutathione S-transferase
MVWRVTPQDLFDLNPAGRVPILVHDSVVLWESRQIWSYIETLPDSRGPSSLRTTSMNSHWREANAVTLGYEVMSAMMTIRGMAEEPAITSHPYLTRSAERRDRALRALDQMACEGALVEPGTFGLAEAVLICATDALVGRNTIVMGDYPHLETVRNEHSRRKSMVATLGVYAPG